MSVEQFDQWYTRRSHLPLAVKGHTFVFKDDDHVVIDGGRFYYEEAMNIVKLLNSNNPLMQISAAFTIAERNGFLRLAVLSIIGIIIIAVLIFALR